MPETKLVDRCLLHHTHLVRPRNRVRSIPQPRDFFGANYLSLIPVAREDLSILAYTRAFLIGVPDGAETPQNGDTHLKNEMVHSWYELRLTVSLGPGRLIDRVPERYIYMYRERQSERDRRGNGVLSVRLMGIIRVFSCIRILVSCSLGCINDVVPAHMTHTGLSQDEFYDNTPHQVASSMSLASAVRGLTDLVFLMCLLGRASVTRS